MVYVLIILIFSNDLDCLNNIYPGTVWSVILMLSRSPTLECPGECLCSGYNINRSIKITLNPNYFKYLFYLLFPSFYLVFTEQFYPTNMFDQNKSYCSYNSTLTPVQYTRFLYRLPGTSQTCFIVHNFTLQNYCIVNSPNFFSVGTLYSSSLYSEQF